MFERRSVNYAIRYISSCTTLSDYDEHESQIYSCGPDLSDACLWYDLGATFSISWPLQVILRGFAVIVIITMFPDMIMLNETDVEQQWYVALGILVRIQRTLAITHVYYVSRMNMSLIDPPH